ncbi:fasciclin domain-containing protein [Streptomyces sp. HNM0645]|uniref:fasciclin domain-containing protein n=1 Tax=Streptomyces sp. HNM0645 TaxID=2782343 RepID=UPI0024B6ACF6|nr:fasciclin domain-containing protein [Streptomyces sp. HNM0645]MDI9887120.1 fasciclin domain-containing protein [Streptomyces sp. HNM0645]
MTIDRLKGAAVAAAGALLVPLPLFAAAPTAQAGPAVEPFGPGCAALPTSGEGSPAEMADDPVATAASHQPELSTLVSAVQKAGLVETLNSADGITLFAPTNDAFAKIPKAQLDAVLNDQEQLKKLLTYHVVGTEVTVDRLPDGRFKTLEGAELATSGSGDSFKVNGSAAILCGDVPTSNAVVHIVDQVLQPPS